MRDFLAVLTFEVRQRRLPLMVAPAIGCLPWLLPVLTSSADPRNLRMVSAVLSSLLFGWILAALLGASAIAADLKRDRLGFFFSQPVRGTTLWAAKLTAAAVLAIASAALIALPVLSFDPPQPSLAIAQLVLVILASFPVLVVLAHVAAVSWHGRNAWLGLDLGALAFGALIAVSAYSRMMEAAADHLARMAAVGAAVLALVAITAATWIQVIRGRASLARSNRILSSAVAIILVATAAALWGFSSWALDPPRDSLTGVRYARPHGPDWIEVVGAFRGRPEFHPAVLIHRSSDAMVPLPGYPGPVGASWLSDGNERALAWWSGGDGANSSLWWVDLQQPEPRAVQTGAQAMGIPCFLALSPSADRAGVLAANPALHSDVRLTVHELPSGRVVASRSVPHEAVWSSTSLLLFESESRLALVTRVFRDGVPGVARLDFDVATGRFETPWRSRELETGAIEQGVSADGELFRHGFTVYSTRTLEPIVVPESATTIGLMRQGRVAMVSSAFDDPDRTLAVHGSSTRHEVRIPGPAYTDLIAELEDGRLIVSTMRYGSASRGKAPATAYWLADPPAGSLLPLGDQWRIVAPGASGDLVAVDRHGGLFEIDAGTGAATELVAGRLPADYSWWPRFQERSLFAHLWSPPRASQTLGERYPLSQVGLSGRY